MTVCDPKRGIVHGYVLLIGPETNPNYFTGTSYSALLDDAKVYRTARGANYAAQWWQRADCNPHPLPATWFAGRRTLPVSLKLEGPML